MRQGFWWVLAALVAGSLGVGAATGFAVHGPLRANATEIEEGYFAVAEDTTLVVRPGSPLHHWLRQHTGRTVRVTVEVE